MIGLIIPCSLNNSTKGEAPRDIGKPRISTSEVKLLNSSCDESVLSGNGDIHNTHTPLSIVFHIWYLLHLYAAVLWF